jgi:hypothetical protein
MPHNFFKDDFEFYYLVELTKQKIKPLSRWEKQLTENGKKWVLDQGLYIDTVIRKTLINQQIVETIFSTSSNYLNFYKRKFNHKLLRKNVSTQKLEGFLFGYPSCCVRQFINKPYIGNHLAKKDQAMLFHWACPDCRITPDLLPYYRSIYKQVNEWYDNEFCKTQKYIINPQKRVHKKLLLAAIFSLLFSAGLVSAQNKSDSLHFLPIVNDSDIDGLNYTEEFYQGTAYNDPLSQNGTDKDGQFWSLFYKSIIDTLPDTVQVNKTYKLDFEQDGQEICEKCGMVVNMGFVKIVNPMRNLETNIPYIGLHYMENGCFSFWGDIHHARVDIDSLKKIIYPFDPAHMLSVIGDSDGDGLTDSEEDSLYLNPNVQDTNNDGFPDGAQIAEQLIRIFPKLKEQADNIHSNINLNFMYGLENCQVCGSIHNMGYVDIQNPENNRTSQIHFNGLHAMAHGSFAYDGTTWPNQRVNAVDLYRTMKTHMLFIEDDSDNDGLKDSEEQHFGSNPDIADTDGDGICDGMELSLSMTGIIDGLPTSPITNGPYVIHYPTFGSYNCLICGETVNMGFMELFNPNVGSDSLNISYYAYHFLKKGSFAFEGRIDNGTWIEGRIDPIQLAQYLEFVADINPKSSKDIPEGFTLNQNYPNPFNLKTDIEFSIPESEFVTLKVYNILGQEVITLVSKELKSGNYTYSWNAEGAAGGIYFYTLRSGEFTKVRKMVLLK